MEISEELSEWFAEEITIDDHCKEAYSDGLVLKNRHEKSDPTYFC